MNNITWRSLALAGALALALAIGFFSAKQIYSVPQSPLSANQVSTDSNELKLDASYLDFVGIKTETVSAGNLSTDIIAPATVEAAPSET